MRHLIALLFLLTCRSAFAADDTEKCESALSGPQKRAAENIDRLHGLKPLVLDVPTVRKAMESLISEIGALGPHFDKMTELEERLRHAKPEELPALREEVENALDEWNDFADQSLANNPQNGPARKLAEGAKML